MSFFVRVLVSAAGGFLAAQAMPPRYAPWLALPLGIALIYAMAIDLGRWRSSFVGVASAAGYFAPLLAWMEVVGTDAWALVTLLCTFWWGVAFAFVPLSRRWPYPALVFSTIWTAAEIMRDSVPWGGFGWGQFGVSAPLTPFIGLAPNVGQIGATWLMIVLATTMAELAVKKSKPTLTPRSGTVVLAALLIALTPVTFGVTLDETRSTRIAVVQGGVDNYGLGSFGDLRAVLKHHVDTTLDAKNTINTADLVVWPENAADINPQTDALAAQLMNSVVNEIEPPVLLGAVQVQPDNTLHNISLLWTRNGYEEKYVKRKVVPFGEFMPFREFVTSLTDRAALMPRDFTSGDAHGSIDSNGVHLGILICFEVADTGFALTDDQDASAWIVHTNNATYQFRGQSEQQLLAAQMRAAETTRPVLVSSTSGISAIIDRQGRVAQSISQTDTGVMTEEFNQVKGRTPAMMLYPLWKFGLPLAALLLIALGMRRKVAR